MTRSPCVRCGNLLHTGEGKVTVSFSLDELESIATETLDPAIRRRVLCAIGLLDEARERAVENAPSNAEANR